ncbi:LysE family translocator [Xanthomonas fragariae]|nr:LysE family translocator [Xanthomonas fragariae]AOD16220.1 amino acid permease [Xanthomonas fragariae]AOD19651.1 amino acid permease [Xanthomonas fragariae]MBL9197112.1 LysE family translocator [Xanthomonas fragariae]MBL9222061.1 LysE family translocator [Xanthomonas fragariae]SMQ96916.1 threonine efflux protein [Xanthomonas fragariae]
MDIKLTVLFAIAFTCAVAVPGPNVAFAIAQALKHGIKIIAPCSFGFGLATAIHAAVAFSGIGLVIQECPLILNYLRWIGAIYLTYLALVAFFYKPGQRGVQVMDSGPWKIFADTLLVALTNPKGWLATLLTYPSFISPRFSYVQQAITLSLAGMVISFFIYGGYMLLAQKARSIFDNEYKINLFTGFIYAIVAAFLAII